MSVASLVRPAQKPQIDSADIITVREAAALFKCSAPLIYKLVEDRKLPAYRVPGTRQIRFLRSELLELMRSSGGEG